MVNSLKELLQNYNSSTLSEIISRQGLLPKGHKTKENYVRILSEYFSNQGVIKASFNNLSQAEREAVYVLMRNQGHTSRKEIERDLFIQKLIERYPNNNMRSSRPSEQKPQIVEILKSLLMKGLVFAVYEEDTRFGTTALLDFRLSNEYYIPKEIRQYLGNPPPAPTIEHLPVVQVEHYQESSARAFQRDIFLYWRFVNREPLTLIGKEKLSKRDLVELNRLMLVREPIGSGAKETDFPRLVFLRGLMNKLGLLEEKGDQVLSANPSPTFFTQTPEKRLKICFDAYVNANWVNELAWNTQLRTSAYSAPRLPAPSLILDARRILLLYLKDTHSWVSLQNFIDRIHSLEYEFLFKRDYINPDYNYYYNLPTHPYTSYTNPLAYEFKDIRKDQEGWEQVESKFIRDILIGPLFWMGLVDLGFTKEETKAPDAFRLTTLGAGLFGTGPMPPILAEGGQVIVQPNYQIMAFDPISDAILMDLSRFSDLLSAERVNEFKITRGSVYRGQTQGWEVPRIRAFLEGLTTTPLPDNVIKTLDEWQTLYERITIHRGVSFVHAATPEDLDRMISVPDISNQLGKRFDSCVIEVKGVNGAPALYKDLIHRDFLPLISSGNRSIPGLLQNSVEIGADGEMVFAGPVPDLFLHGQLARFAESIEHGYKLTQKSVSNAARQGISVQTIVEEIEKVSTRPLPEKLIRRIRAWSGYYGSASISEVTLVQFKDPEILSEVLNDPNLRPLLMAFQPIDINALAKVKTTDLTRLIAFLEELGLNINRE